MLTETGLKVLEFNVRLGDPEAEVVLPMCQADWPRVFADIAAGHFDPASVEHREGACVAVVIASANYPYGKSEPAEISVDMCQSVIDSVLARFNLPGERVLLTKALLFSSGTEEVVCHLLMFMEPDSLNAMIDGNFGA